MATLEVIDGDITTLEVDAIANAANTRPASTAAGSRARSRARAGPRSRPRATSAAPIELGAAVATGAGELPCRWVIHAATMHLGGPTSAEIIGERPPRPCGSPTSSARARWRWSPSAPASAASRSTEAARIEAEAVRRHLEGETALERIVFCVRGDEARTAFEAALAE